MTQMRPSRYAEFIIEINGKKKSRPLNFVDVEKKEVGFIVEDGFENVAINSDGFYAEVSQPRIGVAVLQLDEIIKLNPIGGQGYFSSFNFMMDVCGFAVLYEKIYGTKEETVVAEVKEEEEFIF